MSLIVGYDVALPTPQTYAGLQASLKKWLNRSDLDAVIPDFITLAEERLSRLLRVRQMEVSLDETAISSNTITVPTGTVGVKTMWVVGYETTPLKAQGFDFLKSRGTSDIARYYAWQGDTFYFDGSGTVTGVLYQRIPALSEDNTTNWVLSEAPSAYLFGALQEAFDYTRDDVERDRWGVRLERAIDELNRAEMRDLYSGPLSVVAQ